MELPEKVYAKLAALGDAGTQWRLSLPALLDDIEHRWGVAQGRILSGGSEALVIETASANAGPAVLKLGIPGETGFEREVQTLLAANGRGYARVLAVDIEHRAVLLERLGPQLEQLDLPVRAQIEHICETLRIAWQVPPGSLSLTSGDEKARWLGDFIASSWAALERPCSENAMLRALQFSQERATAHNAVSAVLVHGDAHSANTLLATQGGAPLVFRFVDPDGLFAEPACDLAVPMRDWSQELLDGDTIALGLARCDLLSALTGTPAQPIWQWGFLERMSTGLYLLKLGLTSEGRAMLRVAEAWAVV